MLEQVVFFSLSIFRTPYKSPGGSLTVCPEMTHSQCSRCKPLTLHESAQPLFHLAAKAQIRSGTSSVFYLNSLPEQCPHSTSNHNITYNT